MTGNRGKKETPDYARLKTVLENDKVLFRILEIRFAYGAVGVYSMVDTDKYMFVISRKEFSELLPLLGMRDLNKTLVFSVKNQKGVFDISKN